jgi:hypothetical protein
MKGNIQSIIFHKEKWTLENSKKWLSRRKRRFNNISDVDETETSYRYRQALPTEFSKYRTIKKKSGISFVLGYDSTPKEVPEGSGLRNDAQKFLPEFIWAKYPGEHHAPGYNYLGPGTRLDIRLDDNMQPKPGEEPINQLDNVALHHDIRYSHANGNLDKEHEADLIMLEELKHVKPTSALERFWKWIAGEIISAKVKLGMGIDDDIMDKHGYGLDKNNEFEEYGIDEASSRLLFAKLAKEDGSL